jgi:hypothetical protein
MLDLTETATFLPVTIERVTKSISPIALLIAVPDGMLDPHSSRLVDKDVFVSSLFARLAVPILVEGLGTSAIQKPLTLDDVDSPPPPHVTDFILVDSLIEGSLGKSLEAERKINPIELRRYVAAELSLDQYSSIAVPHASGRFTNFDGYNGFLTSPPSGGLLSDQRPAFSTLVRLLVKRLTYGGHTRVSLDPLTNGMRIYWRRYWYQRLTYGGGRGQLSNARCRHYAGARGDQPGRTGDGNTSVWLKARWAAPPAAATAARARYPAKQHWCSLTPVSFLAQFLFFSALIPFSSPMTFLYFLC